MDVKALSVRQPWASLIASGQKTIEVRSWPTSHRGKLLICASKRPHRGLPVGVAVCVVRVMGCRPMTRADAAMACCDFVAGAYAWELSDAEAVPAAPVVGKLRLFTVSDKSIPASAASLTPSM